MEHPREHRAVRLAFEAIQHAPDRLPHRRARVVGRRLLGGVGFEVRQPRHQSLVPPEQVFPRDLVEPEHETERPDAHRVGELTEQVASAPVDEPVDELVGELRDHALRPFLYVPRAERRLDDPPDPRLAGPFGSEHVHAHRSVQGRGIGGGREDLRREVDCAHVLMARHEPQLHGRDPAHRLLIPEEGVDGIGVSFELLQRDLFADRHPCLPASHPSRPMVRFANAVGTSSRSVAIESFHRFRNPNSPITARISTISPSSQWRLSSTKCSGVTAFGTTLASRANRSATRSASEYSGDRSKSQISAILRSSTPRIFASTVSCAWQYRQPAAVLATIATSGFRPTGTVPLRQICVISSLNALRISGRRAIVNRLFGTNDIVSSYSRHRSSSSGWSSRRSGAMLAIDVSSTGS